MSASHDYLERAEECDWLANDASTDELREQYRQMAKVWRTLAVNPAPNPPKADEAA